MRSMKMLVALAAMTLMAIGVFGAGSASAYTVFCAPVSGPDWCKTSEVLPAGSVVKTSGPSFRIREQYSEENAIECDSHEFTLKSTAKQGFPTLPAEFQANVPAAECRLWESPKRTCTSATVSKHSVEISPLSSGAGYTTVGSAGAPLTLSFTCPLLGYPITCQYKATEGAELGLYPGTTGSVVVPVSVNPIAGELCGTNGYMYLDVQTTMVPDKRIGHWTP